MFIIIIRTLLCDYKNRKAAHWRRWNQRISEYVFLVKRRTFTEQLSVQFFRFPFIPPSIFCYCSSLFRVMWVKSWMYMQHCEIKGFQVQRSHLKCSLGFVTHSPFPALYDDARMSVLQRQQSLFLFKPINIL